MSSLHSPQTHRTIMLGLALLVLSGCQLGPRGIAPGMPQPAHYGVEATAESAGPNDALQYFALGERPVPNWWEAYQSPRLTAWVEEALKNNYALSQAEHSLAGSREQLRANIGETTVPSLDASLQPSRQRTLGLPALGPQTSLYNVYTAQLHASYSFDLFGAARYANSALSAQVDAQSYQRDAARRAIAANVVIVAIDSAALNAQIESTQRMIALAERDTAEIVHRFDLGSASRGELLNAQASEQTLRATLPGLRTQWQQARHALAVLMGRTPDSAPPDLVLDTLRLPPRLPVAVPSSLLQQRPDILAADALLKAAAAQASMAVANMYPSLSISASYGQSGFTWPSATAGSGAIWGMGASLTQPIFHGGALKAKRNAAQAEFEASRDNYRQTVLAAFQNVADTLSALTQDAETYIAARNVRAHDEQFWRDAEYRATLGAVSPFTVRSSERQYQNARIAEIRAVAARLTDSASLFQAMGERPLGESIEADHLSSR